MNFLAGGEASGRMGEDDGMRETIRCPEAGCVREVAAELIAQIDSTALLIRTYLARCPEHGEFRQPELIDRAVTIGFPAAQF